MVLLLAIGGAAAALRDPFGSPVALSGAAPADIRLPLAAPAPGGDALIALTRQDPEQASRLRAYVRVRRQGGRLSALRDLGPGREVLAAISVHRGYLALVGRAATGQACCVGAAVAGLAADGRAGRTQTLLDGLQGPFDGDLLPLGSATLAVLGSRDGVWVSAGRATGSFPPPTQLSGGAIQVEDVAAAAAPHGRSFVAWTQVPETEGQPPPAGVYLASGAGGALPNGTHLVRSADAQRRIDELAAAGGGAPALGWVQDRYGRTGHLSTEVDVVSLAGPPRRARLALSRRILSGLTMAANSQGDGLIAFRACTRYGSCQAVVSLRRPGRGFGAPQAIGPVDPGGALGVALSASGSAVAAWVNGGDIVAATLARGARRFSAPVAAVRGAASQELWLGPLARGGLALFSQGQAAPRLYGAPLALP